MEIKIENYTKKIGKALILDEINYTFTSGKIYGLHGRNGSGKTMLLRALSGLIFPTQGRVVIDNKVLHQDISFPDSIGLIIEKTELLPEYDAYTNLKILSEIKKIATDEDIYRTIKMVGLEPHEKKKVRAFSLGMKQKLSIAQAVFEKPKLLLLDEPTNALDEESVLNIRNLLLSLKEQGCLIIIASHSKEDLAILADEQLVIDNKKLKLL